MNVVIEGRTSLKPAQLLKFVKKTEKEVGRVKRFRWGPREIDIDILFYGKAKYKKGKLTIPHPRVQERDFVLRPLMDLSPAIMHPIYRKTVRQLYKDLPKTSLSIIGKGKKLNAKAY